MSIAALHAASLAKLTPVLTDRPALSWTASKLLLGRMLLNMRVPQDGAGAAIRQISVRITDRCNLRCHTCGQWGENGYLVGQKLGDLVRGEVPLERYIALLDDLIEHGHRPGLYLWGGEPMLYRGTVPLIEAAAKRGLPVSIATNATLVADNVERLVEAPMYLLQVSIDGPDRETHNGCRPGASAATDNYATVLEALEAVGTERRRRGRRLPILAGLCTINRRNADRLVDIYDAFADRLDVLVFYLAWWIDEESASAHTHEFMRRFGTMPTRHLGWIGGWRPDDYEALSRQIQTIAKRAMTTKGPAALIIPQIAGARELERYYTDHNATFGFDKCTAIYRAVEVNANGDVSLCRDYHDYVLGNVKTQTITEIWSNEAARKFRRSLHSDGLMPVCTRCCGLMGN